MADLPRASLRAALALVLVVVALLEALALLNGVRSVRRIKSRALESAEQQLRAARVPLEQALARGVDGWNEAARAAGAVGIARFEVLDEAGRTVFAQPGGRSEPPAALPDRVRRLPAGASLAVTTEGSVDARVAVYLRVAEPRNVYLRLSSPAPDVQDEVDAQRLSARAHMASLLALAVASALLLRREREAFAPAPARALEAYEEAMGRLRHHGEEMEARHDAERQRMADALRDKDAMARAGELTAGIVHEVRNGLGTIVGYSQMIERGASAADTLAAARQIRQECDVLEGVIRRFTDFVRIEELRRTPTDVTRLLSRVAAREQRGRAPVVLRFVGLEAPLVAELDEALLERALENVLRNALEAASQEGGHVTVSARRVQDAVEICVADDGPGLPSGHSGEIRPFFTTRPGGLGLGLPLARKIVLLHGGELTLESSRPHGVSVTITLPGVSSGPDWGGATDA